MTRVWPIGEFNGRDLLAEWCLERSTDRARFVIRLYDGNEEVHIHHSDAEGNLAAQPATTSTGGDAYRRLVTDTIPGYLAHGWTLVSADVAEGIDAVDAEFSAVRCPSCAFKHPWWNGAMESCRICDTATDLEWLPYDAGLNGLIEAGEHDSARNLLRDLSHTLATGEQLLSDLPEGKQRTKIAALIGPARAAQHGATARLRAVAVLPTVQAATEAATPAMLAAIAHGADVGGWLAGVLAGVAAQLGSVDAVTLNRPGSWEADLVHRLVAGTVGLEENLVHFMPATATGDVDDDTEGADR